MAILAYKTGQIKSKIKAANVLSVPNTNLCARLDRRKQRAETRGNNYKLDAT